MYLLPPNIKKYHWEHGDFLYNLHVSQLNPKILGEHQTMFEDKKLKHTQ